MTQTQTEYFSKTYQLKSIAAAAEALYVSRSVVSRAIGDLEDEFGSPLFIRSKSGVEPTDAGTAVYNLIVSMGSSYRTTVERLHQLNEYQHTMQIHIGVSPSNSVDIYRLFLRNYMKAHPQISIHIEEMHRKEEWSHFLDGELDVAFLPGSPPQEETCESVCVHTNRLVMGVSVDHPLAQKHALEISDILDCPLGGLAAPIPRWEMFETCFAAFSKKPKIVIRTSSTELLREMTAEGQCCALLTAEMMEHWSNVVSVPLRFFEWTHNYMVWNKGIPHSKAFWDFIDYVKAQL